MGLPDQAQSQPNPIALSHPLRGLPSAVCEGQRGSFQHSLGFPLASVGLRRCRWAWGCGRPRNDFDLAPGCRGIGEESFALQHQQLLIWKQLEVSIQLLQITAAAQIAVFLQVLRAPPCSAASSSAARASSSGRVSKPSRTE